MNKLKIHEQLLKFFYLNNFHRICVYLIKLTSFFDKKIESRLNFYKFFKKRKIIYSKKMLLSFYEPSVFIFSLNFDTDSLLKKINNYKNIFKASTYINDQNINIYQSEHDLNKKKEFLQINIFLENYINKKISFFYCSELIKIKKMWFVITQKSGIIKKHSHFDSDLSGVLYLKVDEENIDQKDGLKIYNPSRHMKILRHCNNNNFITNIIEEDSYIYKPKVNEMIIFNSYIEHSVENFGSKISERISFPFDLEFQHR